MADRRDDEKRFRGERRDLETERRIDRLADRYRGSDERGYVEGERLGGYGDRTPHTSLPYDVEHGSTGFTGMPRHGGHGHSDLIGLHDMDDLSELRERYRESRRERDYSPRYGHGPGVENIEPRRVPRPIGRGPKGYQRSDDRIREDVCERLMASPYDASDVEVTVSQGEVTLTGTVRIRADKWGIEDVADSVLGVQDVHNQIRLNRGEAQTSSTTLAGDTGNLHS
jgi:hypothetical protein